LKGILGTLSLNWCRISLSFAYSLNHQWKYRILCHLEN